MVISIGTEKASDKMQYPFHDKKIFSKLGEKNFLNLIKGNYKRFIANIIVNDEKTESIFPKTRNKTRMSAKESKKEALRTNKPVQQGCRI